MEYAKDEIFNITYNSSKNKLEMKRKNWTTRLWQKIKKAQIYEFCIFTIFHIFHTQHYSN